MNLDEIKELLLTPINCPPELPPVWVGIVIGLIILRLIYNWISWFWIPTVSLKKYQMKKV